MESTPHTKRRNTRSAKPSKPISTSDDLWDKVDHRHYLLEHVSDAIITTDLDFRILDWNHAAEVTYGWQKDEVIGKPVSKVIQTQYGPDERTQVANQFLHTGSWQGQVIQLSRTGATLYIQASTTLIKNPSGIPIGVVSINRNVTEQVLERQQSEESLRASEQKLRNLIAQSQDGISLTDEHGRVIEWNSAMEALTGLPASTVLGEAIWEVQTRLGYPDGQNPATREQLRASLEAILQTGQAAWLSKPLERAYIHPDGTTRYVQGLIFPIETGTGFMLGNISRDITERKRIESVLTFLAQSGATPGEDFFQTLARYLAELLGVDYVCIDRLAPGGLAAQTVAVYFDGCFEDNVTYTLKDTPCGEVVGKAVCCFHRDVRRLFPQDAVLQEMGAESYAGVTLWDSKGQPLGLIAVIGRKPMANPHLAEAILGMVAPRAAGELERQQAENALHISLEKYRVLFEAFPLGITITDQQGRIIEGNNAAERLLGIPRAEHTQRQIDGQEWQIIRADGSIMPASEYASTRALNENRLVENVEMGLVKEVGQVTWINVTAAPIPLPGYGVAITYSDITERKLAERAVQLRLELIQYAETHSLRELLQKTLDEVEALTGSLVGFYHFVETDQKTLALQAWSTRTQRDFCRAEGQGMHYSIDEAGVWVDCVRQHHAVIHNDYASLPHRKGLPNGHAEIVRELVAPIMRNDQIVAILGVGNKPQPYTQNDIDIVTYVADIAWEITERKRAEELLYATLREKETMLAEIHHRVKNNLQVISSLLDFQYRYTDDAQARAALRESRGRVHSMALIHEQLYQAADLTRINFSTYVTSLLSDLLSTYQSQTQAARIDLDLQDVHLSVKQAIPCGLIINELVSNAFKYAFPETAAWPPDFQAKICVAMGSTPQDEVRLTVSDNGVGLPQNIATSGDSTLGMFLIETFVQQLRGKVSWSGQPGTTCQITFKR